MKIYLSPKELFQRELNKNSKWQESTVRSVIGGFSPFLRGKKITAPLIKGILELMKHSSLLL